MVEVKDHGPGLSEEDQRKLYGRFARLSARPTAGESSTGLELSIVKRLAECMDGELACRSLLGVGTTFSLALKMANYLGQGDGAPFPTVSNRSFRGQSS